MTTLAQIEEFIANLLLKNGPMPLNDITVHLYKAFGKEYSKVVKLKYKNLYQMINTSPKFKKTGKPPTFLFELSKIGDPNKGAKLKHETSQNSSMNHSEAQMKHGRDSSNTSERKPKRQGEKTLKQPGVTLAYSSDRTSSSLYGNKSYPVDRSSYSSNQNHVSVDGYISDFTHFYNLKDGKRLAFCLGIFTDVGELMRSSKVNVCL